MALEICLYGRLEVCASPKLFHLIELLVKDTILDVSFLKVAAYFLQPSSFSWQRDRSGAH